MLNEDVFFYLAMSSVLGLLISTFLFARISVRFIEKRIYSSEEEKPFWDGIGIRIGIYALAILSERMSETTMVPGKQVRAVARTRDFYLALIFQSCLVMFVLMLIIFSLSDY
ncbi:MAG: hypothetical protein CVV11_15935 [Gammaproteobacteria bacterium HGW-Gammaproteobacteria-15]|nr:MAG: hypothetical protein CVV11_15935 [Gammaproteobacteria bacterium HGW-Gammaproteobacteria-15]